MSKGSILAQVRKQLTESGASEHEVFAEGNGAQALFQQMQDLRAEMNEAKKEAAAQAAIPYMEEMAKLERRYAMLIKLASN
jgi:hypothetical protein